VPIPFTQPPAYPPGISPTRFASTIRTDSARDCQVGLLGLAHDLGVKLNNGRPGAKDGPRAFREALCKYGVADPHGFDWPKVFDAGDIIPAEGETEEALHETHRRVTAATKAILDLGLFPIAIGGGHDLTFPFVRGVIEWHREKKNEKIEHGIYFDAHLDVRETVGSGMPFRRLIEDCGIKHLDLYGINPFANSRAHVQWFLSHGGHLRAWNATPDPQARAPFFASLDLDVLDASVAPGVSAINPNGALLSTIENAVFHPALAPGLRGFDIMELNPRFDIDGRTARVAAHLFLTFLRGYAQRPTP
jgi:arginase family enzyme